MLGLILLMFGRKNEIEQGAKNQGFGEGWTALCWNPERDEGKAESHGCRTGGPDHPKNQEGKAPTSSEKGGRCIFNNKLYLLSLLFYLSWLAFQIVQ